jgi:hypothetical protein
MSRKPRSDAVANNRVTTRLTNAELATLRRLAAADELNVSAAIRRLIDEAGKASNFIDARHSHDVLHRDSTIRAPPIWVFTLHLVPGRSEPLCVRRKVTRMDGAYVTVALGRGISASFDYDAFAEHGFALSGGRTHPDRHDGHEVRFGLMPHVVAYLSVPTEVEREEWRRCRRVAFELLRASHVWTCWGGSVRRFKCTRVRPNGGDFENRGDVIVNIGGGDELQYNAFAIAYGTEEGACPIIKTGIGSSRYVGSADARVFLERPGRAESAKECHRERERQKEFDARWRQAEEQRRHEEHRRAQEQKAKDIFDAFFGRMPSAASLNELGLK